MKDNLLVTILLLTLPFGLAAQGMSLKVIGAAGGTVTTSAGTVASTIGEIMVSGRSAAVGYWGEGFQQVLSAPVVAVGDLGETLQLTVYPNPAADYLIISTDAPLITVQLYDLLGRSVGSQTLRSGENRLDLSTLPQGMYLLQAFNATQQLIGIAKIQHLFH